MSKADKVRRAVLRAEPHCRICAREGLSVAALTVVPIVALDQGGRALRSNLQPVCARHGAPEKRSPALARILRRRLRMEAVQRGIDHNPSDDR